MHKPIVIVPTFNEAPNIIRLVASVRAATVDRPLDILVVDDNSPDGTADLVRESQSTDPRLHLIVRTRKAGLGAAYQAGFRWALDRGYSQLVQMDSDFSHPPGTVPKLLDALEGADFALGSRYVQGGRIVGWTWIRRFISAGGNLYARTVLGGRIRDLTGGFAAWRANVLHDIGFDRLTSRGYVFMVELKYRSQQQGFRGIEIPITFEERQHGVSKMSGAIFWEAAYQVLRLRTSGSRG